MNTPAMGSFSKNPAEVRVRKAGVVAMKNAVKRPASLLWNSSLPKKYENNTKAPKNGKYRYRIIGGIYNREE